MVYVIPSCLVAVEKKITKSTQTKNLFFILLIKENTILGKYAVRHPSGIASNSSGSLG